VEAERTNPGRVLFRPAALEEAGLEAVPEQWAETALTVSGVVAERERRVAAVS
jgi:hypothetical protein